MAGLIVLFVAAVWIAIAVFVARAAANRCRAPALGFVVFVSAFLAIAVLPFADELVGRWQFKQLCDQEAKVWVAPNATAVQAAKKASLMKDVPGRIFPISAQVSEYVDATTGEPFLRITAFHTSGGLVMRAGLNMGSSSSCWPPRWEESHKTLQIDELLERGEK